MKTSDSKAIAFLACALAALLLAAGCGGGSDGSTSGSSSIGEETELSGVLTEGDCGKLGEFVEEELGRSIAEIEPFLTPPAYACMINTNNGQVGVQLETAPPIRAAFLSQVVRSRDPVPGLGEAVKGKAGAYWTSPLNHLYVYGENGYLDVFVPVEVPDSKAREEAIEVAKLAVELTA